MRLGLVLATLLAVFAVPVAAWDRLPPAPYAYQQLRDPAQEARQELMKTLALSRLPRPVDRR